LKVKSILLANFANAKSP